MCSGSSMHTIGRYSKKHIVVHFLVTHEIEVNEIYTNTHTQTHTRSCRSTSVCSKFNFWRFYMIKFIAHVKR